VAVASWDCSVNMSAKQNGDLFEDEIEVADDEDYCDKKIKKRLLNTREMLIQSKNELETERLIKADVEYNDFEAFAAWANLIQSYIYELGILLKHPDVPDSDYYREQIPLGAVEIVPIDCYGIPFSKIAYDAFSADDIVFESAKLKRGARVPEPERVEFTGLMDVAQTDVVVEKHWVVTTNPMQARPNQNRIEVVGKEPVPRNVFQQALVESDQFLQNAGIGLDIQAEAYTADGEPGL